MGQNIEKHENNFGWKDILQKIRLVKIIGYSWTLDNDRWSPFLPTVSTKKYFHLLKAQKEQSLLYTSKSNFSYYYSDSFK